MITISEIQKELTTEIIGKKIYTFNKIDSTNLFAKSLKNKKLMNGTFILAEEQILGRGRFDRKWISEKSKNLTFSILLLPKRKINNFCLLSIYTAGSIAKSVEEFTGKQVFTKWPNDLLIGNKKFCGILLEGTYNDDKINRIIIGIGINVNQISFPEEIKNASTSLINELGFEVNRIKLLGKILNDLDRMYIQFINNQTENLLREWKLRCNMFGKNISILHIDKEISGKAIDIDEDGGLIIESNGKLSKYFSGDITIQKKGK